MEPINSDIKISRPASEWIQPVFAAFPITVMRIASIPLILAAGRSLGMSTDAMTTWLAMSFLICGVFGLVLCLTTKEPVPFGFSNPGFVFVASMAGFHTPSELQGAILISGVVLALLALFNLTEKISRFIPNQIIKATLAGALIPFISEIFNQIGIAPAVVGTAFLTYVLAGRFLNKKIPPILPTIFVGFIVAYFTNQFSLISVEWAPALLKITKPEFTFGSIFTIVPVVVILATMQGNIPSLMYLRSQGYEPFGRLIEVATGIATAFGSFFGMTSFCIPAIITPTMAGPEAGPFNLRYWSVVVSSFICLGLAFVSGMAAGLFEYAPVPLLYALAGFCLFGVVTEALQDSFKGPLRIGPMVALGVSLSKIILFDLGSFFWALVFGIAVSVILERDKMNSTLKSAEAKTGVAS